MLRMAYNIRQLNKNNKFELMNSQDVYKYKSLCSIISYAVKMTRCFCLTCPIKHLKHTD